MIESRRVDPRARRRIDNALERQLHWCVSTDSGVSRDPDARPVDEARGRPLQVALVRLRQMGGIGGVPAADRTPLMGGDALAAMEDFDGRRRQAGVDVFVDERVGDRVVMAVELDVIVDADAPTFQSL